jgi:hypothetical protein
MQQLTFLLWTQRILSSNLGLRITYLDWASPRFPWSLQANPWTAAHSYTLYLGDYSVIEEGFVNKQSTGDLGYMLGNQRITDWFPQGEDIFSPCHHPMGSSNSFPWLWIGWSMKISTHPSNVKLTNAWSHISTPPGVFMVGCLIKQMNNFTVRRVKLPCPCHEAYWGGRGIAPLITHS